MQNEQKGIKSKNLFIFQILVPGEDVALEFRLVRVPKLGCLGVQGARTGSMLGLMEVMGDVRGCVLVRLAQQALQAEQNTRYVVDGAPLVLEDVEADAAGEVDVGVVDRSLEEDCWGRVGVVVGECEGKFESEALVGSLGRTGDGCCPREEVSVCVREGGDAGRGREHELHKLSLQAVRVKQIELAIRKRK